MSSTIQVKGRSIVVTERRLGRRTPAITPDSRQDFVRRVEDIEDRVKRLTVSRHDPERFHMQKSEIADDLRQLATALRK